MKNLQMILFVFTVLKKILFFILQKSKDCKLQSQTLFRAEVSLTHYIYTFFKKEIFDIYRNNIEYGDRSDVLMKQGYWPSYNIP